MADQLRRARACSRRCSPIDPPICDKAHEIKEVEHQCDFLTHEIIQRLNKTFVTPIDREDIHALASRSTTSWTPSTTPPALIPLYRIDHIRPGARELTRVIINSDRRRPRRRVEALEQRNGVLEHAVEINRLENEADRIHQQAIGQLFDEERDPIAVIKWKEILDMLEEATDRCEDVANLLENVVVKHG